MKFDYSKLRGKIKEVFGTQGKLAKKMGISQNSLSSKLNNKKEFYTSEIYTAIILLKIDISRIDEYFFTLLVTK